MLRGFPSQPRTRVRADGRHERGGSRLRRLLLGEQYVISRGLCHYEIMPTPPGRPGLKAVQAARLAAKARTPIRDPQVHLDWHDDWIGVWSWPRSVMDHALDFEGRAFPETVLQNPDTGPRLVSCMDGYEAQVWENGILFASRWWPNRPDSAAWRGFLRGARALVDTPEAAIEQVTWSAAPARQPLALQLVALRNTGWRDAAAIALILLAAPTLFFTGQLVHLQLQKSALSSEVSGLQAVTSELGAARGRTQQAVAELNAYANRIDRVHPVELLAVFAETTAQFETDLEEFAVRQNELSIVIAAPTDFAPARLVEALEALPAVTGVLLEPGRRPGQWRILASVETNQ